MTPEPPTNHAYRTIGVNETAQPNDALLTFWRRQNHVDDHAQRIHRSKTLPRKLQLNDHHWVLFSFPESFNTHTASEIAPQPLPSSHTSTSPPHSTHQQIQTSPLDGANLPKSLDSLKRELPGLWSGKTAVTENSQNSQNLEKKLPKTELKAKRLTEGTGWSGLLGLDSEARIVGPSLAREKLP